MPAPLTTELERLQQLASGRLGDEDLEQLAEILNDRRRFDELVTLLSRDSGTLLDSLRQMPRGSNRKARRVVDRILQGVSEIASAADSFDNTQSIPAEMQRPMARAERTHPARRPPAGIPVEMIHFKSFRIRSVLGRGGMGTVFQADDERLGRQVAIKTLNREIAIQPGAIDRFLREARTAARVEHDHICPIYQVGEENGIPFIAMPLLKGEPLNERMKREHRIAVSETLRLGREMALGLAAAHEAGLIHRDIKPANIWLETQRGRQSRVRILDFGLARGNSDDTELSTPGLVMGTPAYMSPEQARGQMLDARADLWSLGVILYEMVVGNRPFTGTDSMALLTSIAVDEIVPPEKFNLNVTPQFSSLIMRLLSKKPERRPPSAADVVETIQQIQIESTFPMIEEMPVRPYIPEAQPVLESEFANLDDDRTFVEQPPEAPKTGPIKKQTHSKISSKPLRKKTSNSLIWPATGLSGLMLVVIVVAVMIMNKVRPPQQVEAVEPVKEEVKKESKPTTPKPVTPTKVETEPKDPDRRAAEYVFAHHGFVRIDDSDTTLAIIEHLPKGPFRLRGIHLVGGSTNGDTEYAVFKGCKHLKSIAIESDNLTDAALAHFKDCKNLTELNIGPGNYTDDGLAYFKDCKNIENITLRFPKLTDAGLAHFSELQTLQHLALISTPKVTSAGFLQFTNLRNLKFLCLMSHGNLKDDDLAVFKNCENLKSIQLDNCKNITDSGMEHFKNCKNLNSLVLSNFSLTDKGLAAFVESTEIRSLQLYNMPNLTDATIDVVRKLPLVDELELSNVNISLELVTELKKARPNGRIRLNGVTIGAPIDQTVTEMTFIRGGMIQINDNPRILDRGSWFEQLPTKLNGVRFEPNNARADDEFLSKAAQCKNLRNIWMWKSAVTDVGLAHFKGAKQLIEIHFEDTAITDAGIAHFSESKQLAVIGLNRTQITDEGLKAFKGNTSFTVIGLDDTKVGTAGLSQFGECKALECLGVAGTRIVDDDLDLFKESKMLRRLYLGRTQVTDACVPKLLRFKNLAELGLQETKISPEKIAELQNALPKCRIILEGK